MERTLTAFSAIILLIGCCTGCGRNVKTSKIKIPDIAFLYYKSSEAGLSGKFCVKNGNCYSVLSNEVNYLKPDELMEQFSEGSLEKDIKLLKTFDKDELEKMYIKFAEALDKDDIGLVLPEAMPAVEAPTMAWYGVYYDENGCAEKICIHENKCMTGINSGNNDINDVYRWLSDKL
ncbi:hypothetical protein SAMN02910265_00716 [Ruminococcus flavefaciens]|uniref:Lipoprotein n=1 Tax=Ruminococcus flavefaciens TaxID=1265 RepID=A0A1H6IDU5_RUMFL|nr:hypothetical protein [Ruminococcus flavefaciens]SEH45318.1 hypothetical protein SAMN02910265_00716 [Ruminococcus flavefaciens]